LNKSQDAALYISFAVLAGIAIPALVFGRAVFAVIVALAGLAVIFSSLRPLAWRGLLEQANRWTGRLVLLTLGIWLISAFVQSPFPLKSAEAAVRTVAFLALGIMIFEALKRNSGLADISLNIFIASAFVFSVLAIAAMTYLPELFWLMRLKGWIGTPLQNELKSFSSLAVLTVPLLAYGAYTRRGGWRAASIISLLIFLVLVWITYNRATMAGLLGVVSALSIAAMLRGRSLWSKYGPTVVLLAAIAGLAYWLRLDRIYYALQSPQSDWLFPIWLIDFQRQAIWTYTLEIFQHAPWFGVGANTINFVPGASTQIPGTYGLHAIPSHPHNWGLEVLAETGVLGLLGLCGTVIATVFQLLKRYRASGNFAVLTAIMIMGGFWVSGLFNYSFWSAWWQVSFFLSVAIALAHETND